MGGKIYKQDVRTSNMVREISEMLWSKVRQEYVGTFENYSAFVVDAASLTKMVGFLLSDLRSNLGYSIDDLEEFGIYRRTGPASFSEVSFGEREPYYEIRVRQISK